MPHLYSLTRHETLQVANPQLLPSETLIAYLDDIYTLCSPGRATEKFRLITNALRDYAGNEPNLGERKIWNKTGIRSPNIDTMGCET